MRTVDTDCSHAVVFGTGKKKEIYKEISSESP